MISKEAFDVESFLFCDYFCAPRLQGEAARELLTALAGGRHDLL